MAFLPSKMIPLFASESHLLTGVYMTSYPKLFTVKFLILTFPKLENHFNNNIFLPQFPLVLVNNLIFTTCQHHLILISSHCQKFFSKNFNFRLLGNHIWPLNFLLLTLHVPTPQTNIVIYIYIYNS